MEGKEVAGGVSARHQHVHHVNPEHQKCAFAAMNGMRQRSQLCDVALQVGGVAIPAHKVVLAASSAYFNAMFNSEMSEKHKSVIVLHEVDISALQLLVDFAYTGEILITDDNVQALLPAASLVQICSVREACCKFLLRQLHATNCLGIRSFADAHSCEELHVKSHRFALRHFQDVAQTEEFLLLPVTEVIDLISSDQLNVTTEECVYNAVMTWIRHDLPRREQFLGNLLQHVRLPLTAREFLLITVGDEPLVQSSPESKDLLIEAMKYHLMPERRSSLSCERTRLRHPDGLKPYLFAIGGGSLFAIHNECEYYNPRTDRWAALAPNSQRRSRAGVASLGRLLYAVGGYDGTKDLASAEFYNPASDEWKPLNSMGTKRSCLGIVALNELIYVAGGYDGASCLNNVERYDPLVGTWTSVMAMESRRRYCRLATLDGCIYAGGGYDGTSYQSSVERLDPREGIWRPVHPMINRRSSCGVAALGGMLYAVGGNDGSLCMSSVERFDPVRNAWEAVASMHSKRSTHEAVVAEGFLYAVGGNDGSSSLNTVERFDHRQDKWMLVTSMMLRRSSVGATVLDCPNMEQLLCSRIDSQNQSSRIARRRPNLPR